MKSDIQNKIQLLISKPSSLSESEVLHLMTLTRKYLDYPDKKIKEKFLTLRFFCDWALHIAIDRSLPAMEMLVKLNDTIVKLKPIPNNALIIQEVTRVLLFPTLRKELNEFLSLIDVKDEVTTDDTKWDNFLEKFTEIIRDCALMLPDPPIPIRIKPYYDEIVSNPIKDGFWTIGLSISKINESWFKGDKIPSQNSLLCLILYSSDSTKVVIPLEKREFFNKL